MPNFAANLTYLFREFPLLERFEAAASVGFRGVEYQFPYGTEAEGLRRALENNGLEMVLINAPPGDWEKGERGLAGLPGRESEFRESINEAIYYATALGCPRIHVMAGLRRTGAPPEAAMSTLVDNLSYAADTLGEAGIHALIEPLNPVDVPGYMIAHALQARGIMAVINHPNLFLQYDLYHGGMNSEDLLETVRSNLDVINHFQVAGVPGRHEPDTGDVRFEPIFEILDEIGYAGWIGCEYTPRRTTIESLEWASIYGIGRPFRTVG